ncbi:MAG: hypothetical protein IH987_21760, partial [Planctomycetes bacterium]|nr:hypothetical protein [Planctomycetota bacterium]
MILTVTPFPCVDKTVYIDRLEAGRFMRSERYVCVAGGKGVNASRAVKALGRSTRAFVVVGSHSGEHVVEMISEDDGVECIPVRVKSPTRTITTALETEIQRQTALYEPGSKVTPEEYGQIVAAFRDSLKDARVVCFSGTVSDPAISRLYSDLIPIAKEAGAITIL